MIKFCGKLSKLLENCFECIFNKLIEDFQLNIIFVAFCFCRSETRGKFEKSSTFSNEKKHEIINFLLCVINYLYCFVLPLLLAPFFIPFVHVFLLFFGCFSSVKLCKWKFWLEFQSDFSQKNTENWKRRKRTKRNSTKTWKFC